MQLSKIVSEIQDVIQDSAYSSNAITALINEANQAIALGVMIPGRYERTPPLPDLYTTGTVTTETTGIVTLPSDYQRSLVMVVDSNDVKIPIKASAREFLKDHPETGAGDVYVCAQMGKRLLYRDIPSAAATLTVHYYAAPDDLSDDDDEPTWVPEHLHRKLYVSYACKEIFNKIEDGVEGRKINTEYYTSDFASGLIALEEAIGVDKDPDFYDSDVDYCR
jgi:hypothetical protein